jgi:hypothetical protein
MTEEAKTPDPVAQTEPAEGETPKAQPSWEFKKTFGINQEMKKVIQMTIAATQSEIVSLKRKLDKLTYGA